MEDRDAGTPPWIDDDGILRAVFPARPRTAEDVDRFAKAARRLLGGRTARLILDARQATGAPPEAYLRAIASVESIASAVAFVVSETTPDSLQIYQTQIDSLLVPCRLFGDTASAEAWIDSLGPDTADVD